ncbi:UDP-N-acetylglucosamine pyrophosphorylase [Orbilia oligospora]|uniref:UDP-N-acetylglucosamine diphosphorylase n=1 Tax=Orbilia oligospora TaxID=2813651 RepID=A0A7C8P6V0_ORBOL|nr:UDP-N-acetylglucosamine pyrophosphorylase [Orbilia oligospora]KAF3192771.1 UDP-N-acetylglucosamine pyrophosphorylase [Orbilia oligospora]KAF3238317.1 UDP-N-acetylglucosamine pyrophosphorylase [Orbilia oligospora]KAF3262887.1 UDP-N-acetylglucosamine pyrophosphorylase [Orbilia oligospora]KAF3287148.1 UDP-N-acetylglucosamine pyrophosphorylase [Orbilia oligospora]
MAGIIDSTLKALHLKDSTVPPSDEAVSDLKGKYSAAGQPHVFNFYDSLSNSDKLALFNQLSDINPARTSELADKALNPAKTSNDDVKPEFEPLPTQARASTLDSSKDDLDKWYNEGLELIASNRVGVILMAGGQGTRLGSSDPKGCYDIGLPSRKSLFQIQAERISKIQSLADKYQGVKKGVKVAQIPWYIMTSGPTRKPTEEYFVANDYFGLEKDQVVFFEQGVLPCISNDGKIILESRSKVAVAPDGNGGIYAALDKSGILKDLETRGIEHVHAYCVDNCLVKVADPVFIGFSALKGVSIATKVVRKRNAKESVGLILLKNGKPDVVEYSEIDKEMTEELDPENKELLKFRAANIVNHYYSTEFLNTIPEWSNNLPHHIARKKIPYLDTETGEQVKPEKPNGIKLEQFVFDVFPMLALDKFACLEVAREDEFSPLKNARGAGEDDPDTSRRDIMTQGKKWVQAAGAQVLSEDADKDGIEVSPLLSYGGEGLEFLSGKTIKGPALIVQPDEAQG